MRRLLSLLSLSLSLSSSLVGCYSMLPPVATFTPLNSAPAPLGGQRIEEIEVFAASAPTRPFVEVGLLEVSTQDTLDQDVTALVNKLRQQAAAAGCDGVYGLRPHDRSLGTMGVLRGYEASCIVYRERKLILSAN